jgi:4,5-dihydroxyphthalate decarboxylase
MSAKELLRDLSLSRLRVTLACGNYDRTKALMDGKVQPEGIDLNFIPMWVEEIFHRMLRHEEFDVSEMSLSGYTATLFKEDPPFISIPVFPSRMFRQRSIYVNVNSGIKAPKDLIGKNIGVQRYRQTAGVYIRGMLADYYGVPIDSVTYYAGGLDTPEAEWKFWGQSNAEGKLFNPKIKLIYEEKKTLSKMLADGELDAVYSARDPSSFREKGNVVRLFPNYRKEEQEYFRKTGIFPIMHIIVIRRKFYEENKWVAQSLVKAFTEAKQIAYKELYAVRQTAVLNHMLPWMNDEIEETTELMGRNYWPYGLQANMKLLKTFLRYSYEQGISKRQLKPEELFVPETIDIFQEDDSITTHQER